MYTAREINGFFLWRRKTKLILKLIALCIRIKHNSAQLNGGSIFFSTVAAGNAQSEIFISKAGWTYIYNNVLHTESAVTHSEC